LFEKGDVVPTFFDVIQNIGNHRYTLYRTVVPQALNVQGRPKLAGNQ
jgi:hypothetical protein